MTVLLCDFVLMDHYAASPKDGHLAAWPPLYAVLRKIPVTMALRCCCDTSESGWFAIQVSLVRLQLPCPHGCASLCGVCCNACNGRFRSMVCMSYSEACPLKSPRVPSKVLGVWRPPCAGFVDAGLGYIS